MNIEQLDRNFSVDRKVQEKDCVFYKIKQYPFEIHGLYCPQKTDSYIRLPQEVAKSINDGVAWLSGDTSGGRIRFSTTSKYVAIRVNMPYLSYPHQSLLGSAGFSLFIDRINEISKYYSSFIPPTRFIDGWESIIYFDDNLEKNITIYMPTYCHVYSVEIGLQKDCELAQNKVRYLDMNPIIYYGASQSQGACASVPSNSYQGFLHRWTNIDYVSLTFSGSAKGESEMANYIANQKMSLFVMDYDHNAPNSEYLRNTHFAFYKTIRDKNPNIPIMLMSKHDFYSTTFYVETQQENINRRQVVIDTFNKAKKMGDNKVYFIDGKTILGKKDADCCTVDGTHPNDLGFYRMAKKIYSVIKKIL